MIVDYVNDDIKWFRSNQRGETQNKKLLQMRIRRELWHQVIDVEDAHQERGRQQGERAGGAPWLLKLAAHQTNED